MYAALLVALDGDFVVDYIYDTKEEVIDALINRGSQYFFYPLEFVIKYPLNPNGYIVDNCYDINKRVKIKTVLKAIESVYDELVNDGSIESCNIHEFIHRLKKKLGVIEEESCITERFKI